MGGCRKKSMRIAQHGSAAYSRQYSHMRCWATQPCIKQRQVMNASFENASVTEPMGSAHESLWILE